MKIATLTLFLSCCLSHRVLSQQMVSTKQKRSIPVSAQNRKTDLSFSQTNQDSINRQNDKKSIDRQVNRLVSDLNTHEFKNMDSYTTDDVEWVNIVGMWWKGRTDVKKAHEWGFNKFFKGVPFTRKKREIRFLTNDVAVVHLVCHVGSLFPPDGIDRGTNRTPETDDLLTLVYLKKNKIWLLAAGQNTHVDPEAAKSNPEFINNHLKND